MFGLERLAKAIAAESVPVVVVCEASAGGSYCASPTPSGGYTTCGSDNQNVTCGGVNTDDPPGFTCTNYNCNSNFDCEDFTCHEGAFGDFDCKKGFDCPAVKDRGAKFHCQGGDFITDQFNCYAYFKCNPNRGDSSRFTCDDFHCEEGNFWCYVEYNGCSGVYRASLSLSDASQEGLK